MSYKRSNHQNYIFENDFISTEAAESILKDLHELEDIALGLGDKDLNKDILQTTIVDTQKIFNALAKGQAVLEIDGKNQPYTQAKLAGELRISSKSSPEYKIKCNEGGAYFVTANNSNIYKLLDKIVGKLYHNPAPNPNLDKERLLDLYKSLAVKLGLNDYVGSLPSMKSDEYNELSLSIREANDLKAQFKKLASTLNQGDAAKDISEKLESASTGKTRLFKENVINEIGNFYRIGLSKIDKNIDISGDRNAAIGQERTVKLLLKKRAVEPIAQIKSVINSILGNGIERNR